MNHHDCDLWCCRSTERLALNEDERPRLVRTLRGRVLASTPTLPPAIKFSERCKRRKEMGRGARKLRCRNGRARGHGAGYLDETKVSFN